MLEIPFRSARQLAADIKRKKIGCLELLDLYLARVEKYDGALNAVVVRDFERARQRARAADEAAARGERAALLGLPITLKESINVAGLATTCGVPEWKGFVSAHDAPTAARLLGAGTVLTPEQVDAVAAAGGRLIVSPNIHEPVIARAVARGLDPAPGFATASEAFAAYRAGARGAFDVASVNNRIFINNSSIGIYPQVVRDR